MSDLPQFVEASQLPDLSGLPGKERTELATLMEGALDQIPLRTLGLLCADHIFGKEIDNYKEDLFLSAFLDETEPLQSEMIAKLCATFEHLNFNEPETFSIQLFRRKAGFGGKIPDPEGDSPLGQYTAAMCLKDYQVWRYEGQQGGVQENQVSQVFTLGRDKDSNIVIPKVPQNYTRVPLGNGKATLKPRNYLCILVWAFWSTDPNVKKEPVVGSDDELEENGLLEEENEEESTTPRENLNDRDGIEL